MNIVCLGGGPAGLYFAVLMKLQDPAHVITVVERNRPFDTFGWGVVLSDQTLGNLRAADPVSAQLIGDAFNHWDDVEMFFKGKSVRSGGHGFCGIGRKKLLNILQERCMALGVDLVFEADVQDDQAIAAQYNADVLIACDGLNSRVRTRYADTYKPDVEMRDCRFVWLGTKKPLTHLHLRLKRLSMAGLPRMPTSLTPTLQLLLLRRRTPSGRRTGLML